MNNKIKYYIIKCRKLVMRLLCFRQLLFSRKVLNLLEAEKETPENIKAFVNYRLNLILDSAGSNALFYRRNKGNGLMDFPVVDKTIIKGTFKIDKIIHILSNNLFINNRKVH